MHAWRCSDFRPYDVRVQSPCLVLPGRKRVVPYSIQWLKRLKPAMFRQDLIALFDLLRLRKIKPVIAQRFRLDEARQAHELLGKGGVTGKFVLVTNGTSRDSGSA